MTTGATGVSVLKPGRLAATRCHSAAVPDAGAFGADVRAIRRMISDLFQYSGRRSDEHFQRNLDALQTLLLDLRSMALTDELTRLRNRRGLMQEGNRLLAALRRDQHRATLFYFDVDNLKAVNDADGHDAGDALLVRMAQVLTAVFRKCDVVGRLGGDEFMALAPMNDPQAHAVILERMQIAAAADNAANGRCRLSFSMGTAQFDPASPLPLQELMKAADITMYHKKLAKLVMRDPAARSRWLRT